MIRFVGLVGSPADQTDPAVIDDRRANIFRGLALEATAEFFRALAVRFVRYANWLDRSSDQFFFAILVHG